MKHYKEFTDRLKLLIQKKSQFITTALSNIFTMRLIGNKTHGDLAEIGIAEFINQFMYDYRAIHVGKDLYRAKEHEEDLQIINPKFQREKGQGDAWDKGLLGIFCFQMCPCKLKVFFIFLLTKKDFTNIFSPCL